MSPEQILLNTVHDERAYDPVMGFFRNAKSAKTAAAAIRLFIESVRPNSPYVRLLGRMVVNETLGGTSLVRIPRLDQLQWHPTDASPQALAEYAEGVVRELDDCFR